MGAQTSADVAYGVPLDLDSSTVEWWDLPNSGEVISMGVGEYGGPKNWFLVIAETLISLEPGESRVLQPYSVTEEPVITWDAKLVATAEDLKVPLAGRPGWVFALDEN